MADLVKWLDDLAAVEGEPTATVLKKAADRIKKLEAALNCNLPDYDPKIGIVERLRQLGNWRVDGTKSSPIYNKSVDHIKKLEAALRKIKDLHHGPEDEEVVIIRDDMTYFIVCEALGETP